jgi:ribosomal protein L39E
MVPYSLLRELETMGKEEPLYLVIRTEARKRASLALREWVTTRSDQARQAFLRAIENLETAEKVVQEHERQSWRRA